MNPKPPQSWLAVLFDLDGTLADTTELILACYRHTMRTHLGEERPDEEWLEWIGTPLRDQLRIFAREEAEVPAMVKTYVAYQETIHDRMARAFPGVVEIVEALGRAGTPAAIVTSKGRVMGRRTLRCCGLQETHFAAHVFADDVTRGKPDPEPVLLALERLAAAEPGRVLFVGDSPHDVAAGRAAGVRTAAALWGAVRAESLLEARPDYVVERVEELAALCGVTV